MSSPAGREVAPIGGRERVAFVLATWFGCGRFRLAPGTAGTLGAVPLYLVLRPHGALAVLAAAALVTAIGVWSGGVVARRLGRPDPACVCIDEVAGVLVTWLAATPDATGLVTGFVVFRVLDVVKPWPACAAERLPGGWGVVMDDVLAGAWGALLLLALR